MDQDKYQEEDSCSFEALDNNDSNNNAAQPIIQAVTEESQEKEDTPAVTADSGNKRTDDAKLPAEAISSEVQEAELEADVLEIIGEPDRVLASPVHSYLATIWCEIIEKGLPAEERKTLLKKFPPPKNCISMDPPKLNLEVKAAVNNTIQKRDE